MTRIAIVVEGQTELDFVDKVLSPNLWEQEVYPSPRLLGHNGGNVSVDRLATDMASYLVDFDYVTSLVDFYGFRDKGNLTVQELEQRINEEVSRRVRRQQAQSRAFAYVQLHEFEGLLFSDVYAFERAPIELPDGCVDKLLSIRTDPSFPTPEDINDSPDTAPSRRIADLVPRYRKRANGSLIAEQIGLDAIRRECPRFNAWVARMESLSNIP